MVTTKQLLAIAILLGSATMYGAVWADNHSIIGNQLMSPPLLQTVADKE